MGCSSSPTLECLEEEEAEEEEEEEEEEEVKWLKHYSSAQEILLVGEGDFSFSVSLASAFRRAGNITATSLEPYDAVIKKYKKAKSNLETLEKMGATLLHGVDAKTMKLHTDLKMRKFDRIIFNFPHAGFKGKEDDLRLIKLHTKLVHGFFSNARRMLRPNGEVHISHKTGFPYFYWNLEELAVENSLKLKECIGFKIEDYPGYNNKRGDGKRCDQPFPLGECSTYMFILGNVRRKKKSSGYKMNIASAVSLSESSEINSHSRVVIRSLPLAQPNKYICIEHGQHPKESLFSTKDWGKQYTHRDIWGGEFHQLPPRLGIGNQVSRPKLLEHNFFYENSLLRKVHPEPVRSHEGYPRANYRGHVSTAAGSISQDYFVGQAREFRYCSYLRLEELQRLPFGQTREEDTARHLEMVRRFGHPFPSIPLGRTDLWLEELQGMPFGQTREADTAHHLEMERIFGHPFPSIP